MPSVLRACLIASAILIVLGGGFVVSREGGGRADHATTGQTDSPFEMVLPVTAADEERLHRVALKEEAAIDMLDGRLTLAEAGARFLDINSSDPESMDNMRLNGDGATDEELALYQVLSFARIQAARNPSRYAAALVVAEQEAASRHVRKHIH